MLGPSGRGQRQHLTFGANSTKVNVSLDNAQPPNVSSVVLTTSTMAFLYQPGMAGDAQATNAGNTYHITGTVLRCEL